MLNTLASIFLNQLSVLWICHQSQGQYHWRSGIDCTTYKEHRFRRARGNNLRSGDGNKVTFSNNYSPVNAPSYPRNFGWGMLLFDRSRRKNTNKPVYLGNNFQINHRFGGPKVEIIEYSIMSQKMIFYLILDASVGKVAERSFQRFHKHQNLLKIRLIRIGPTRAVRAT